MREIKFRGMDLEGNWHYGNLCIVPKDLRHIKSGSYISNSAGMPFAFIVRPETVGQLVGQYEGQEIYDGDILEFWLCYSTTQTHRGNNIPTGSYTEPDEPQLVKCKGKVVYCGMDAKWDFEFISKPPYQSQNAFHYVYDPLPIIGKEYYSREQVMFVMGWDNVAEGEFLAELREFGFNDMESLMNEINTIKKTGNIYELGGNK